MAVANLIVLPARVQSQKLKNIIGYRSGKLEVISLFRKEEVTYAVCRCDCGTICEVRAGNVHKKNGLGTQSCGCARYQGRKDYTEHRFGLLQVEEMVFRDGQPTYARAMCDCGKSWYGLIGALVTGNTTSCGCAQRSSQHYKRRNLVGKNFERLHVIGQDYQNGVAILTAQCWCGGVWQGEADKLTGKHTKSCGCLKAEQTLRPLYLRERSRILGHRRRARERQLPSDFTRNDFTFLFHYWQYACAICGNEEGGLFHFLALDHWIPLANPVSPGTVPWNMLPLCHWKKGTKNSTTLPYCNGSKGPKDPIAWLTEKLGPRKARAKLHAIETYFTLAKERKAQCSA